MEALLTSVNAAAGAIFDQITAAGTTVVSTPILLLPAGAFLVGVGVKLFRRLL